MQKEKPIGYRITDTVSLSISHLESKSEGYDYDKDWCIVWQP